MSGHRRAIWSVLLTMVVITLIAACGIPKDGEPRLIAEEPEGLGTTSQPASDDQNSPRSVSVFLIDPQAEQPHLVERERATKSPDPIEAVIRLLGPITEEEAEEGLISRIVGDTVLLLETSGVTDGVATLDLSSDIETVAGDGRLQAYAQLVYTATQFPAQARTVRFLTEGQPVTVPTVDQGDLAEVTRGDYRDLGPEPGS